MSLYWVSRNDGNRHSVEQAVSASVETPGGIRTLRWAAGSEGDQVGGSRQCVAAEMGVHRLSAPGSRGAPKRSSRAQGSQLLPLR